MKPLPRPTLLRLALYLQAAQELEARAQLATSSAELAQMTGVQPFHVRKDLALLGRFGRRGQGYAVALLRRELSRHLGLERRWQYVVVGLGPLGEALLTLDWGEQFVCVGLFDPDPKRQGRRLDVPPPPQPQRPGQLPPPLRQLRVRPLSDLSRFTREQAADIALLSLSGQEGQEALSTIRQAGIDGILSLGAGRSPHLPPDTHEENDTLLIQVDLQLSLQRLAFALLEKDP